MSSQLEASRLTDVAQKWRRLAEQRQAYLVELYHSGRWKHYYTEERFLNSLREAIRATERWTELAPSPAGQQQDGPPLPAERRNAA